LTIQLKKTQKVLRDWGLIARVGKMVRRHRGPRRACVQRKGQTTTGDRRKEKVVWACPVLHGGKKEQEGERGKVCYLGKRHSVWGETLENCTPKGKNKTKKKEK